MKAQLPRAGTLILALSVWVACGAPDSEDSGMTVVTEPGNSIRFEILLAIAMEHGCPINTSARIS